MPKDLRYRRYPEIPISMAIQFCAFLKEQGTRLPIATFQKAVGVWKQAPTKDFDTAVAACKHFGLVATDDVKKTIYVTDLGLKILNDSSQEEKQEALAIAFLKVDLFKTLAFRFREAGKLPMQPVLKDVIKNELQIETERGQNKLSEVFVKSGIEAGVFEQQGDTIRIVKIKSEPTRLDELSKQLYLAMGKFDLLLALASNIDATKILPTFKSVLAEIKKATYSFNLPRTSTALTIVEKQLQSEGLTQRVIEMLKDLSKGMAQDIA
ncbi:MAG: hypothetical protein QW279_00200 [Candidatus Jordarchaeaceae archaeon]